MVAVSFTTLSGFRALYEAEYGFVWSAVRRFGVPSPLLEDAVQDTFIVAYRRRDAFTPGPARPWLYGIARGVASNYRRTARRVARKREALATAIEEPSRAAAQISLQALDRFLERLSPGDRELFVLSEVEGLTGPELSSALQVRTRTIYRRLERLRSRFADEAIEDGALRPRRPRASAASWLALVPSLRATPLLGLGIAKLGVVAAGVVTLASVGWMSSADPPRTPAETTLATALAIPAVARPSPSPAEHAEAPPPSAPPPPAVPRARPAAPASNPPPGLSQENALLREATQAIARSEFQAALAFTGRHASEFPGSPLADLRTALRIEALCGAGNTTQGRGETRAFIAENPGAPLTERIRRACVTKSEPAGQDGSR